MKFGNLASLRAALGSLGIVLLTALLSLTSGVVLAADLGEGELHIAGTRLVVTPEQQTVPFDTPTLVETSLQGYDVNLGSLPADLRVVAELSGPEISGVLKLETLPNEPFRIPRLRLKGTYELRDIRLEQDGRLLAYAEPRTATVEVTRILVTSVKAEAMSEDEMRSYGIVVGDDSFQAFNLTFGFGVKNGELRRYALPVVYRLYGSGTDDGIGEPQLTIPAIRNESRTATSRFAAPKLTPFKIDLEPETREQDLVPKGGCDLKDSPCRQPNPPAPPMVGVIMFPTDVSLLHQYFSVVLMVQNGAPEGDVLTVRDLTAKAKLPSGLRTAETDPPTPLGVPVPVRAPGPDGEVGTSDDLRLLVAQASGEAEFLVEGLREGSHIVEFDLQGVLEGMPGGPRPITGQAKGAVVVRDPTLSVSLAHPEVVRADEPYTLSITLTNLGNAPVNGIDFNLPASGLSGVELAPGQGLTETLGSLLPGQASTVEFELIPRLTGRVIAASARSGSAVQPSFDFEVGISNGVPLSPLSLALPSLIDGLPAALRKESIGLLGLGHSLSTASPGVAPAAPRVQRQTVHERVYQLVQAARHLSLGEGELDAVAVLAAEWLGSRDDAWEWDRMRRTTDRGLALTLEQAEIFSQLSTLNAFERIAELTHYLRPQLVAASGPGVRLELQSRTSGRRSDDGASVRDLPFVDLYPLDDGALAIAATPESGGYRAVVRRETTGSFSLRVLLPGDDQNGMRVLSWSAASLAIGAEAWVDFDLSDESAMLQIDDDADGFPDRTLAPLLTALAPRPFEVVAAVQNKDLDPSGHVVEVLMSSAIDLESLVPRRASRFTLPGKVSNGGITPVEDNIGGDTVGEGGNPFFGLFNPRIVRVVFDNPISPLIDPAQHTMVVDDVWDVSGREISNQAVPVTVTVDEPGILVTGQVIDPYGQPLPYAEVGLWQWDFDGIAGKTAECKNHRTAAVLADAEGRFTFDYVRQTACSDRFELRAESSAGPHRGKAHGKVRFVGSTQELDVIMVGRGIVKGQVLYDDGTVPTGLQVFAHNPVFDAGRRAWVDDEGNYRMAEVAVGTVTLWAQDDSGNRVFQTIEVPTAGAEVVRDLVMLRRPDATTARLSGRATDFATGDPEIDAYVALYVDGARVNVTRTDGAGLFDFGLVPTGVAEIEAFDGTTGRRGTQLFFELEPDEVEYVELQLRDDRGTLEGFVRRRLVDGTVVPVVGAVVWAEGTPFNATTDDQGHYSLEDVFPGNRRIRAADLDANETTHVYATVSAGVTQAADLYFEDELEIQGGLYGTVRDANDQVVEGAVVHLGGGYWSTRWSYEAYTDDNGRFHIPDLPPGVYGVHALSGNDGGVAFGEIRFPGDTDDVTVRLLSGKIRGRTFVRDELGNVQGVPSLITYRHVEAVGEWGLVVVAQDFSYTESDGDGYFEIDALHGPYELFFYNPFQQGGYRKVTGTLGPIDPDHQIEFQQNGSISGVVWLEDGETPAVGATVKLRGGPFNDYDLTTGEDGRFTFELVPPGRYHITAVHDQGVLFRQERVYAQMRRHGAEMEVEIQLQAQGRVEGYVVDASGAFVPGAVVELRERGYPWRRLLHNADDDGQFSFENIFEGELTLRARAPALGNLAGHECAEITFEGELVQVEIQLEGTGDLRGQVIHPGTGEGVPNARVAVHHSGGAFVDSTQTDADGYYEIRALKLRSYRLRVFDPATGRRGVSGAFSIDSDGQDEVQDVVLEVRGVVQGHLYDPDAGNQPVPGATLQLHSQGIRWFKTYSSTGIEGEYSFEGIPEGDFDISTYQRRRRARASGRIVEEDQVVELDIYFEPQGRIFGRVFGPKRFAGDPGELVTNVNTLVRFNSPLAATTENPFDLDGLPPRATLTLEAREINGDHLADYHFRLRQGEDHEVDVQLKAIGSARIRTLSSTGQPVNGVQVRLRNSYSHRTDAPTNADLNLRRRDFNASTGDDHEVVFEGVRQGHLDVRIEDPVSGLRGRRRALLYYDGEEVLVEVSLQPSGWVRGQVLLSDGITPAASAVVALDAAERSWQLTEADEQGFFEFDAVPLGGYTLIAQQADGPGNYEVLSSLGVDQEEDEYTLILDDEDPYVVSVDPPFGTRDTARDLDVVVTFSEPMGDCGACGGAYLQRISTSEIAEVTRTWSADRTQLTMSPITPLRNHTGYKLVIQNEHMRDQARRQLAWRVVSSFYTADTVPPTVIDVRPRRDAVQVPVDASLEITFSEPLDIASLSGAFTVTDLTAGQNLTTTVITTLDDRRVVVTPVTSFATDRLIEVRAVGVADGSGNAMTVPFTWRFHTPDATPPEIHWTSPSSGQAYTAGDEVQVSADITDNRGVALAVFSLGDWSQEIETGPYEWRIPAPVVDQAGLVTLSVHVTDIFGNEAASTREIFVEPLQNAVPPALSVGCPVDGDLVAPGLVHPVTFSVSDDLAVESAWLLIDGERVDRETPVNLEDADIELAWTPSETAVAGDTFQARLEVRDFAGNITSVPLVFAVPAGDLLIGDNDLFEQGPLSGDVALAAGTFTLSQAVNVGGLTLLHGASLTSADGADLQASGLRLQCGAEARLDRVDLTGELAVESGAVIGPHRLRSLDVSAAQITVEESALVDGRKMGYFGQPGSFGTGGIPWTPAGRTEPTGGASHGGFGVSPDADGASFDSVYVPAMHGAGGRNNRVTDPAAGADGGGVVALQATGTVVLDGVIDVGGAHGLGSPRSSAGAGGSVRVVAQRFEGGGRILASGGEQTLGVAGGGRVAITASELLFDPASQVENRGGRDDENGGQIGSRLAGPGTTLVETAGSFYGTLRVDGGEDWPAEVAELRSASLTPLGQLDIVATQSEGQDLWLFTGADHLEAWLGAFARLQDPAGQALGTFRVLEVDADRLLLEAASGTGGTLSSAQGVYRFDRIELRNASLHAEDPVEVTDLTFDGDTITNSDLEVVSMTVAAGSHIRLGGTLKTQTLDVGLGAVVTSHGQEHLEIEVTGVMTVAAGAVVHADGLGFEPGDVANGLRGYAPSGVQGSADGGSHGGLGFASSDAGETFGSVYGPLFAGGGGGATQNQYGLVRRGGRGGGRLTILAGELVLEGEIRANGHVGGEGYRGGAGGSVVIESGRLSGSGRVLAQGADGESSAGGGGRIALLAGELAAFDPATQASARGGEGLATQTPFTPAVGGAGTVFVSTAASTYGDLYVGGEGGVLPVGRTPLPSLGTFTVGLVEADSGNPADAWVEPQQTGPVFSLGVAGMWARVDGVDYRVLAEAGDRRRVLLEGAAATVLPGQNLTGLYRFDAVTLSGGAHLEVEDQIEMGLLSTSGGAQLTAPGAEMERLDVPAGETFESAGTLRAGEITVAGTLRAQPGVEVLSLDVDRLVVSASGLIDRSAAGFTHGDDTTGLRGRAPAGVLGSTWGGSHGGFGHSGTDVGEVYGSLYRPRFGGAGGSSYYRQYDTSLWTGGTGGGVLEIRAGEVVLDGEIRADGNGGRDGDRGGAGGSIYLETDRLSGAGQVNARGSDGRESGGGGGRIALIAGELVGFDPEVQASVAGGLDPGTPENPAGRGGAGTVFVKTLASTFGELHINAEGVSAPSVGTTPMVAFGEWVIGVADVDTASPADLWIEPQDGAVTVGLGVEGMWGRVSGVDYPVIAEAGDRRRVLLQGAAGVVQVGETVTGVYKFDRVTLRGSAQATATDVVLADAVETADGSTLDAPVVAASFEVAAGAVVLAEQPVRAGTVIIRSGGELRTPQGVPLRIEADHVVVEAGGLINADGKGYPGGKGGHNVSVRGGAPEGIPGSLGGAAHGGHGDGSFSSTESFGSLYRPRFGGAGGAALDRQPNGDWAGGDGGGVVEILTQSLLVDGIIRANGLPGYQNVRGGAGGSLYLEATSSISGTGALEARGADADLDGGGGRIALITDSLTFDVVQQTFVDSAGGIGGGGTVYVRQGTSTWGDLHVDSRTPGVAVRKTVLTKIDENEVESVEVDTESPSNLWIETVISGGDPSLGVEGALVLVDGVAYRVQADDGRRRLLLEGAAGGVEPGDMIEGLHRFDNVYLRGGTRLISADPIEATVWHTDADTTVTHSNIGPGTANCGSGNLLLNPSADEGEISGANGRIPSWIQASGDWQIDDPSWPQISTVDGAGYLWPGHVGSAELYQEIDLSPWSGEIDAGFGYTFFAGSLISPTDDPGRFVVEYRDAAGQVLGTYDSGDRLSSSWVRITDHRQVPALARTARVRVIARREGGGTHLSAVFDTLRFHMQPKPILVLTGNESVDETASAASYTLSLSCARTAEVTATYEAVGLTAQPGTDFAATSGSVTFLPGETQKVVTVPLLDDANNEGAETFELRASTSDLGERNVALQTSIVDDELAGLTLELSDAFPGTGLYPGADVGYTTTLSLVGGSGLTGVGLTATLAPELVLDAASVVASVGTVTSTDPLIVDLGGVTAGNTVTLSFAARLSAYPAGEQIVSQIALSADGIQDVPSDDPATATAADPTATPISTAPEALELTLADAEEGEPVHLSTTFSDPTAGDTFTATVDWGDGVTEAVPVTAGALGGDLTALHAYGDDGVYTVEVCVMDAAGAETCDTSQLTVTNMAPGLGAIDFSDWELEEFPGATPTWTVSSDGHRVVQTADTEPSVLYSNFQAQSLRLKGRMRMEDDNDYVGFVVGFEPGDSVNPNADYLLAAWKGDGEAGFPIRLRVYRITGMIGDPWRLHTDAAAETLVYAGDVGFSHWSQDSDYRVELETTEQRFRLWINDSLELDLEAQSGDTLPTGRVGFYAHAQRSVLFTEWSREVVDLPAGHTALPHRQLLTFGDWTGEDIDTNPANTAPSCDWQVSATGLSVLPDQDCRAGVLLSPGELGFARTYGLLRFEGDDGIGGLAFGLEPGEVTDPSADYLLLVWNRYDTAGSPMGLRLWRIRGVYAGFGSANAELLAVGQTYGNASWEKWLFYQATTHYEPDRFRLWIDGELEIDVTAALGDPFTEGRYGIFASRHPRIRYAALERWALEITEGETSLPMVGAFTDPGHGDTHTATVDWGDGVPVAASIGQGTEAGLVTLAPRSFEDDQRGAELCVTDDDGDSGCLTVPVRVVNAAPTVNAGLEIAGAAGASVTLDGASFTDPGSADTHTATIDWGDGTLEVATLVQAAGSGTLTGAHTYTTSGVYTVTVCVTDDDGGEGCGSQLATIGSAGSLTVELTDSYTGSGLYPGAAVDYTATVTNGSAADVTSAQLVAGLAGELSLEAGSVTTSQGTVTSTAPLSLDLGTIVPGATVTVTFRAHLSAYPAGVEIASQVTLSADSLADVPSDDPATATSGDATATPISTLPEGLVMTLQDGGEGYDSTLSATFSDPTAGDTFSSTIDWGDGAPPEAIAVTATSGGGEIEAVHIYANDGTYTVEICITDSGGSNCFTDDVTVSNVAPGLGAIDFSDWVLERFPLAQPNWKVSPDGRRLSQTLSTYPSVVYSDFPAHGSRIKGRARMVADDDYMGFVVGFEPGDSTNPDADYLLVTWKGANQGSSPVGLRVYRIQGVVSDPWRLDIDAAAQIQDYGATVGFQPWATDADYRFELESTEDRFRLWLNETLELEVTAPSGDTLPSGRVGFYLHSQSSTIFTEWSREVVDPAAGLTVLPGRELLTFGDWTGENIDTNPGNSAPSCDWRVSSTGLSVRPHHDCRAGVFLSPDELGFARTFGLLRFEGDHGIGGLAFGLEPGEVTDPDADYLLLVWNRYNTAGSPKGLRLWRIRGVYAGFQAANAELLAVGQHYGSSSWSKWRFYQATTEYEPDRFRLWMDGELEIDVTTAPGDPFTEGRYGIFASRYPRIRYAALERWGLELNEGETSSPIVGAFTDPGVADTHTATVDWGNGIPVAATIEQGAGTGQVTLAPHTFDDDQLGAELCVTDDAGDSGCTTVPIRVANLPPTVDAGVAINGVVGLAVSLSSAGFTDPGLADTHTATVDWGDGTLEAATVAQSSGSGSVSAEHTYTTDGVYTVTVCVTDDDGGIGCGSQSATVGNAGLLTVDLTDNHPGSGLYPGAPVDYTLTVTNGTGVDLMDTSLAGALAGELNLETQSVTASQGTVASIAPLGVDLGTIAPGATVTVTFRAHLSAYPVGQEIASQVTLSASGLTNVPSDDPTTADAGDATVTPISTSPEGLVMTFQDGGEGYDSAVSATFLDPTAGETYTGTVDWGDGGSPEAIAVTAASGGGDLNAAHLYADDGTYPVDICITDAAANESCFTENVTVSNVAPGLGAIDFNDWVLENYPLAQPNWKVSTDGRRLSQSLSTYPSVVYSDFSALGSRIKGRARMVADDDYMGFVVGFEPGDSTNPDADYLLVTWKGANQGSSPVGLRVYRIQGVVSDPWRLDIDAAAQIQDVGANVGSQPWVTNSDYRFEMESTAGRFRLWLNGNLELDVTAPSGGSLPSGRIGFYLHSQSSTIFTEWSREVVDLPVGHEPLPARRLLTLHDWAGEDLDLDAGNTAPSCSWAVSPSGLSVEQGENCRAGAFLSPGDLRFARTFSLLRFKGTSGFGGMTFGLEPGEAADPNADYLIVTWKRYDDAGGSKGLRVWRIRGLFAGFQAANAELLATGLRYGDTGWKDWTWYQFTTHYEPGRFRLWVAGEPEVDVAAPVGDLFTEGRYGLFASRLSRLQFGALERWALDFDEGDTSPPIVAAFTDAGSADTHSATIDWGDAVPLVATVDQGTGVGRVTLPVRTFEDDQRDATLCITDNAGDSGCTTVPIRVANVAPTVDAGAALSGVVGVAVSLSSAAFTDPGLVDTHTATVDWGDGTVEAATLVQSAGSGTLAADHAYTADGVYTAIVCVTDDDGGTGCGETTVTVGTGDPNASMADPETGGAAALGDTEGLGEQAGRSEKDQRPELALTLSASLDDRDDDGLASPGETVDYTLTVTNTGADEAKWVSVVNRLPEMADLAAGSAMGDRGLLTVEEGALVFEPGDLLPGESATVVYRMTVNDSEGAEVQGLVNRAVVSSGGLEIILSDDPVTGIEGDATFLPFPDPQVRER